MTPVERHDPFLSYVPIDRRHAAATGVELPDRTVGAALFADLSGFTRLTQALATAFGPYRGAEELTRYLAATYDALIGAVHAWRGSVIGFSGDAVTCWFDGDDGPNAVGAGFAIQRAVEALAPALAGRPDEVRLAVKVAVVHGSARRFMVGDPAVQRLDVLAGRTVDRLAACEKLAEPGEVVVTPELQRVLNVPVRETRGSSPEASVAVLVAPGDRDASPAWSLSTGLDRDWLQSWVLPPVRERMQGGANLLAADFRPSAALFLSFRGLDYDGDDSAGPTLDAYVRWVQGVVSELEGAMVQLTFGDKGSYLYCTFGAPVAHDDDPSRAIAAAEILRSPPQPWIRDVKVGVTYGQMYAGAYGSATRCTYGVLGPKTNLAARLMGAAEPGQVLCDADVARHAGRHWRFRELAAVRVKGVDGAIPVFAPEGRVRGEVPAAASLVGRTAELAAVRASLAEIRAGRPHRVVVAGAAGIGKSRLLDAFASEAALQGVRVSIAGEHAWGRETAYRPWRPILGRLLDLDLAALIDAPLGLSDRLAAVAPELAEWAPLLGDVFGVELPATPLTRDLAPESRTRNRTFLLTEIVERRAREDAWLFLFDEVQHFDSMSWDLLVAVARRARDARLPVGLAVSFRPREIDARAQAAVDETAASLPGFRLDLGELPVEELGKVAEDRFGLPEGGVPSELLDLLGSQASGNPFFALEVCQMLLDDGSLQLRPDGGWTFATRRGSSAAAAVPKSLHALVLARIDRAPAAASRTLRVASVVGRRFAMAPLRMAVAAGTSDATALADEVGAHLDALVTRDLLAADGVAAFRFTQPTVQSVAYESLLFAQRRTLHAAIASWHEDAGDVPEDERTALLAHHWSRAADGSGDDTAIDRASHWLVEAAERHQRVSAFAEAADALQAAIALLEQRSAPSDRTEVLRVRLGDMHERLGEYDRSEACLRAALAAAPNPATEGAALASLCLLLTRRGEYDEARRTGERALAADPEDASLVALVRGRLGIVAALGGDLEDAEGLFEATYRHYLAAGQPRNAAAWLNNIGLGLVFQERYDEAQLRLEEALRLSRDERIAEIEAQVLMNLGLCLHKQGDLAHAAERYQASLELSRRLLAREDAVVNVVNLGDIALAQGRPEEAWRSFLQAAREAIGLAAMPRALDALRGASETLLRWNRAPTAAEVVGFVLAHPACNVEVEGEVERVRLALGEQLGEEGLQRGRDRGAARTLEELMGALEAIQPA